MSSDYEMFLSPQKIGTLELKNRSIMAPMGTHCLGPDLMVNQRLCDYHQRRAEGGCALNITEVSLVHESGSSGHELGAFDDKFIPGLTKLADAIHEGGGKACLQLWHPGRQLHTLEQPWAPSAIPCPLLQIMPHEMTNEECWEMIGCFGDAALRAKKAGYDAVEIHGAHGYLIDGFLNAYSNTRTDEFGGSFENRARFGVEVVKDIRAKVGEDFPIIVRMNGSENVDGGIVIEDAINMAKLYEKAGADALDISQGCNAAMPASCPPYYFEEATNADHAYAIKQQVGIPIICPGRLHTPERIESVLQQGKADFAGIGRGFLADPDFVKKTQEGRPDDIVRCVSCTQGCFSRIREGDVSCVFTPATGHEREYKQVPAEMIKNVLVIGGGPSGLEAARVAAERGHHVTLFEKTGKLGGQYLLAGEAPDKSMFADAVIHMGLRAQKAGVDVRLYTQATPQKIKAVRPDVIVVAAGSVPFVPNVPGVTKKNVYAANDVIGAKIRLKASEVVVIGGGLVGLEAAEILASEGKNVHVVEMMDVIGKDLDLLVRGHMMSALKNLGVKLHAGAACKEITDDAITIEHNGKSESIRCGAVVMAVGSKSDHSVEDMVKELGIDYVTTGDAKKPGKILNAIWSANEAARAL